MLPLKLMLTLTKKIWKQPSFSKNCTNSRSLLSTIKQELLDGIISHGDKIMLDYIQSLTISNSLLLSLIWNINRLVNQDSRWISIRSRRGICIKFWYTSNTDIGSTFLAYYQFYFVPISVPTINPSTLCERNGEMTMWMMIIIRHGKIRIPARGIIMKLFDIYLKGLKN